MNEFKEKNKVDVPPIERKKTDFVTEEREEKNEILALIFAVLNRQELTEEQQEKLALVFSILDKPEQTEKEQEKFARIFPALNRQKRMKEEQGKPSEIGREILQSRMQYILLNMAKEYMETGKITQENYEKYAIESQMKVSLGQAVGEWEKDPKKAEKERG